LPNAHDEAVASFDQALALQPQWNSLPAPRVCAAPGLGNEELRGRTILRHAEQGLGEDTPWYQIARLFLQPGIGDWDSVLARVRRELFIWARKNVA
jgi:hypothetical protein